MTEPTKPRARDTVRFGRGSGEPDDQVGLDHGRLDRDSVDAWYDEETRSRPSQAPGSARLGRLGSLGGDRLLLGALSIVTVVALAVALAGWTSRAPAPEPAVTLPAVESHGLTEDQAACFAFAQIESRADAELGNADPTKLGASSEVAGHALAGEVQRLDELAAAFPTADYRLIAAFSDVADAAVIMARVHRYDEYLGAGTDRASRITTARDACTSIAGFDTATRQVTPTG